MFITQWCQQGAHTKVLKIVCGLRTHHVECSKLGKTQMIKDVDAAWLEIPDFAIRIAAPVASGT